MKYYSKAIPKSERITRLVEHLYAKMPEIEASRAVSADGKRTDGHQARKSV